MDDSTFRAYRNNPRFLSSILPLSAELDYILSRIFEHDPGKRIGIPELRNLILLCNVFTTRSTGALPPTPPSQSRFNPGPEATSQSPAQSLRGLYQCSQFRNPAAPLLVAYPIITQHSASSGCSDHGSIFSAVSSCSSTSSCDSSESEFKATESVTYTPPQQTGSMYSCLFPFSRPLMVQPCIPSIAAH